VLAAFTLVMIAEADGEDAVRAFSVVRVGWRWSPNQWQMVPEPMAPTASSHVSAYRNSAASNGATVRPGSS